MQTFHAICACLRDGHLPRALCTCSGTPTVTSFKSAAVVTKSHELVATRSRPRFVGCAFHFRELTQRAISAAQNSRVR